MKQVIIAFVDALIPLGIAALLLLRPQVFTKKDLKADENCKLASRLKKVGIGLLVAGVLILISNLIAGRK